MEMDEAVGRAFQELQAGSDLIKQLLMLDITPSHEKLVIVVFTGYGLPLADYARKVNQAHSNAPIIVLGPDSLRTRDKDKRHLDAVSYRTSILKEDEKTKLSIEVDADTSKDTQPTLGQATVAARLLEEKRSDTALLVTAAYHQPRAYMTLLRSLIKRGIQKRVRLIPKPYCYSSDWGANDLDLKDEKPWFEEFRQEELPRIIGYQRQRDVASWKELKEYLNWLNGSS